MIRYESPDLYLVVFGDGPDRQKLQDLANSLGRGDLRARFTGRVRGLETLFGQAAVVWATARSGGTQVALEAMAAGRPVVGFASPEVAEVVSDGETAALVPRGDRIHLAATTRTLFDDPARAVCLGEAGRRRVAERHGVGRVAEQLARVYREVAGV
jgi:glycosyltransferase involved in cell wall biosynthesis